MYSKCDHCGEFAVDDSENIEVCKSCGIVVEETTFSSAEVVSVSRPTFTPYSKSEARLNNRKKKPLSLQHGQRVLDNLCHINNVSSMHKTEITELFKLVVSVKHFTRKEDAGTTAACCLFLFLRKNKQAISIKTLCKQVPCAKGKFSFYLKLLKSFICSSEKFKQYSFLLNYEPQVNQQNDYLLHIVPSFIREICEKAEAEEKFELMEKTATLVKLAHSCWLFTGRSPRSIIAASAFLCWKSMHPNRKKTLFAKFCSKFEINEPSALLRIPELTSLLLKLGRMLPSRTENYVNEINLLFHLNTILEHSETLRNDLFPDSYTGQEVDAVEFKNFRHPPLRNCPRKEPSDAIHYSSDMNASDIEISDTEIDTYLVSNKEKIIEFCEKKSLESAN